MKLDPAIRDQVLATVPSLRAFAISLCGNIDRADDLVQETLLRALAHINSFQPGTNMPAWLFTILRNLFRSEYRKRRREVEDADGRYAETLKSHPEQTGRVEFKNFARRSQIAVGSARSADPGRRVGLFLRGRRGDLRLRRRHHQEPGQSRANAARRPARHRQRRRFRARPRHAGGPRRRRPQLSVHPRMVERRAYRRLDAARCVRIAGPRIGSSHVAFAKFQVLQRTTLCCAAPGTPIARTRITYEHRVGIGGLLGFPGAVLSSTTLPFSSRKISMMAFATAAGRRHVVDVQDHIIAVGEDAFDLAVIVRELVAQKCKEGF